MSSVASNLEAVGTVIAALVAVGGGAVSTVRSSRSRTAELAKDRAEFGTAQFDAGAKSRDDEVRQMKSERDDARYDRDVARQDAQEWRKRALDRPGDTQ